MTRLGSGMARSPGWRPGFRSLHQCQILSAVRSRQQSGGTVDALADAPFRQQYPTALAIALARHFGGGNPVQAEVAEILPRLAPCGPYPARFEETQRHRPTRTLPRHPALRAVPPC